jgi:hypothetical protein
MYYVSFGHVLGLFWPCIRSICPLIPLHITLPSPSWSLLSPRHFSTESMRTQPPRRPLVSKSCVCACTRARAHTHTHTHKIWRTVGAVCHTHTHTHTHAHTQDLETFGRRVAQTHTHTHARTHTHHPPARPPPSPPKRTLILSHTHVRTHTRSYTQGVGIYRVLCAFSRRSLYVNNIFHM